MIVPQPDNQDARSSDVHRGDVLLLRLESVREGLRWVNRGRRVGAAIWPLPLVAIVILMIDASLGLHAAWRLIAVSIFALLCLRVLLGFVPDRPTRRMGLARVARLMESRLGTPDNAVINALQLHPTLQAANGLPAVLAARAVDRGVTITRETQDQRLVDPRPAARAWLRVLGSLVVLAIAVLITPRLFAMGIPRFVDPLGDHPPFTWTDFDISMDPNEPVIGDDVTVHVALAGRLPREAVLVVIDGEQTEIPMLPVGPAVVGTDEDDVPPSHYQVKLNNVREPIRAFIRCDTGRSRFFSIDPQPRPRIVSARLTIVPPAYAGGRAMTLPWSPVLQEIIEAEALIGSEVELRLQSSMEVSSVHRDGATATGSIDVHGPIVTQRVPIEHAEPFMLVLRPVGPSGLASDEQVSARVTGRADRPPEIVVQDPARPGQESFVRTDAVLPIAVQAMDDVGLSRFELRFVVSAPGSSELPDDPMQDSIDVEPLAQFAEPMRLAFGRTLLRMPALSVQGGETIRLWLTARDNRPTEFGGSQRTVLGPIDVIVLDPVEFQRRMALELDAQMLVQPYEALAEQTNQLENRIRELAEAADQVARRAERDPADQDESRMLDESIRSLEESTQSFSSARDQLRRAVERRLDQPPMLDFDEQMREPLEQLRRRLDQLRLPEVAPTAPRERPVDSSTSGQARPAPDESSAESPSDLPDATLPSRPDDRSQPESEPVEEWLEDLSDAIAQDAEQLDLAADEVQLDITDPAEALKLADELYRRLEHLDQVAVGQRRLADRLGSELTPDAQQRREFGELQLDLMSDLDQTTADLESLGDRAARALPTDSTPAEMIQHIVRERNNLVEAIQEAKYAINALPNDLVGQAMREELDHAAKMALFELQVATDPTVELLESMKTLPKRIDEHGAAKQLVPLHEAIERGMKALDLLEARLDAAGRAADPSQNGPSAQRPLLDGPAGTGPWPIALVGVLVGTVTQAEDPSVAEARAAESLANARLKVDRLRTTLQQLQRNASPLLPQMGESAIALSQRVQDLEIAETMFDASDALGRDELPRARSSGQAAAEALESLYEESTSNGAPPPPPEGLDRLLQLNMPSEHQRGDGGASSSGSPSGEIGTPDALEQLSRNRRDGGQNTRNGDQPSPEPSPGQESGNGPQRMPGSLPGLPGQGQSPGQGDAPGAGSGESGQSAAEAERTRFFNEQLYQQADPEMAASGTRAEQQQDAPGGEIESAPPLNDRQVREAMQSVGMPLDQDFAIVLQHVPPVYRDLTSQYFLKVARDELKRRAAKQDGTRP